MRAMVLTAPGEARLVDAPPPSPGPGQVRVRIEGCGVCASNLTPWAGADWMRYPTEPGALGHEGWGVIDALGQGVSGLREGDRVASLSFHAYADCDLADADAVIPLPATLDRDPVPAEPLGCAVNIFKRAHIRPGDTVAIVGVGFLGALLTQLASRAGAKVIALSRRAFPLDVARRFGAHETVTMDDHWRVIEAVKTLTEGRLCQRVIEATGKQWPLDLAAELTAEGGRLIIAGYHQDGPRQVNMQLWNWRGLEVINAHERDRAVCVSGAREAVSLVAAGELDPAPLYTHRYPLEALGAALDATRDRPDGFIKALVTS